MVIICSAVLCMELSLISGEHIHGIKLMNQTTLLAKRNLDHYIHYYNRYKAHADSLKLESNLKETMVKKISLSESKKSLITDYSWALKGLHRLLKVRRVLMYTYPFAFYMFGDELFNNEMTADERKMKTTLFGDLQEQLEFNVERLSMILEKDFQNFTYDKVIETMVHVVNLSNATDTRCKQM